MECLVDETASFKNNEEEIYAADHRFQALSEHLANDLGIMHGVSDTHRIEHMKLDIMKDGGRLGGLERNTGSAVGGLELGLRATEKTS